MRTDVGARQGERLNVAAVHGWLRESVPDLEGAPSVTQYTGGASNWTYRLRYANRDLVLRRAPAGTKSRGAHDVAREYAVQLALKPAFPAVPTMVSLCRDPAVIGTAFYVMDHVPGLVPRATMPPELRLDAAGHRALSLAYVDKLVELHSVDPRSVGLDVLGRGPGYPRRQVEGWSRRYVDARTWNVPRFRRVRRWLDAHCPDDADSCVIHNDWRLDNLVLDQQDPSRVVAVLDWEMATVGDPLMDLGSALAYWVQPDDDAIMRGMRRQPTHLPGMLRRDEIRDAYLARTGLRTDHWTFYEVFGLFRIAGIAQQIYYRYHHGQTRNPAFGRFWLLAHYLDWRCRRLIAARRNG